MSTELGSLVELDEAFASVPPKPKREKRWDLLVGDYPKACQHIRISRSTSAGLTDVLCLSCGHEWLEVP